MFKLNAKLFLMGSLSLFSAAAAAAAAVPCCLWFFGEFLLLFSNDASEKSRETRGGEETRELYL
jgi:hypothetical protein